MATTFSRSLNRSVQRGVVKTVPLPHGKPMTGVFTESEGPADGQLGALGVTATSDAVFDGFFGGQGAGAGTVESSQAAAVEPDHIADVATPEPVSEQPSAPASAADAPRASRADRFRSAGFVEPAALPVAAPAVAPPVAAPAVEKPWKRFTDPASLGQSSQIRQSMGAAKVLTPLVAAISFAPGSNGPAAAKAGSLTQLLAGVHRCATETAEAISTQLGEDVPSWMVTQLMQALSTSVATRWERSQSVDMDGLTANMREIFGGSDQKMGELMKAASEDAYVEVTHPDIAKFRISVSTANAAWTIHSWVTHPLLSMDPKGEMPSRFFLYNQPVGELVSKILTRCVDECRPLVAQVESADLRTSHMQSSIGRMANLVGSEYVTRTRHLMNWISDVTISEADYQARLELVVADLESKLLPEIFDYARATFIRVEQGAFRAVKDLYEKYPNPIARHDAGTRPATS